RSAAAAGVDPDGVADRVDVGLARGMQDVENLVDEYRGHVLRIGAAVVGGSEPLTELARKIGASHSCGSRRAGVPRGRPTSFRGLLRPVGLRVFRLLSR